VISSSQPKVKGVTHGMDARIRIALMLTACSCLAASHRSRNFLISCNDSRLAQQIAERAELYRHQLAQEWLGHDLPAWLDACPIRVQADSRLAAGGRTTFSFERGQPRYWQMTVQGSAERILDSVLPHEITHMVMATHFGRPLPRWADEGASTTVEHISERRKQNRLLIHYLTSGKGIPFNRMFRMQEYPQDVLPLYAQGHSLARYLLALGGQQRFVGYLETGLADDNWDAATWRHYGIRDLAALQTNWVNWVQQGCPRPRPASSAVRQTTARIPAPASASGWQRR